MRFIVLDTNNKVVNIRNAEQMVDGEIQSETGELGQVMQEDGTFITPPPETIEVKPTLEEQIEQLRQDNIKLMKALADIYESLP